MKIRRVDFSPDEWLAGTAELVGIDRGIYITICALIYSRGSRIEEELIFRHCQDHGNAVRASLARLEKSGKIVRNGSEIGQKRSEKELENAQKRSEKASENVSHRWNNNKVESDPVLLARNANHQPSTINHHLPPINPPAHSNGATAPDSFDDWYAGYPHKVGKAAARTKYRAALRKASAEQLTEARDRYIADKPPDRPWCNPATWLNQERWLDAPAPLSGNGSAAYDPIRGNTLNPPLKQRDGEPLDEFIQRRDHDAQIRTDFPYAIRAG